MFTGEERNECLITVVTCNRLSYTKRALAALEAMNEPERSHVVIVDNGSEADTVDWLREWAPATRLKVKRLVLLKPLDSRNISSAVNLGWLQSRGYAIRMKLDNDVLLPPDWFALTKEHICAGYGLTGWVTCNEEAAGQGFLPTWKDVWKRKFRGFHYLYGGCVCASSGWFARAGYWHEEFTRGMDFEYSIRGQLLGETITYVKGATAVHIGSIAADEDVVPRQRAYREAYARFDAAFTCKPKPFITRWARASFNWRQPVWEVDERSVVRPAGTLRTLRSV